MDAPTYHVLKMVDIDPPPNPARLSIDQNALGQLADDIAANGLLQPIGVAGPDSTGRYKIGFGHRRWLAHTLLIRATIDARVWPADTPMEDIQSAENYQRAALSPVEEAHDVARRLARGESRAAIARILRRSPAWVASREQLVTLPAELQDAVHTGQLTIGVALQLAEIDHEPYRKQLVTEAEQNGASVTTARVWVAHYLQDRARIITNQYAVEEIILARQSFVPYCTCEACRRDVPFTTTRAMRFCTPCSEVIEREMAALQDPGAVGGV
jgi:ParB/RepB/Spo0J family partition protein